MMAPVRLRIASQTGWPNRHRLHGILGYTATRNVELGDEAGLGRGSLSETMSDAADIGEMMEPVVNHMAGKPSERETPPTM